MQNYEVKLQQAEARQRQNLLILVVDVCPWGLLAVLIAFLAVSYQSIKEALGDAVQSLGF